MANDVGCTILHVDMDAFFAMVEVRDRPELTGRPVIVGRSQGRGVVVSATYEARALGVHSAMPVGVARRLAPHAVFIDPSRGKYLSASRAVMGILREFTPAIEEVSIDEAFLDVSSVGRSVGSPTAIAIAIRERMSSQLGLPCSVGVAPVTMVAKIASTKAKPDGMLVVPYEGMLRFLHALPVGALWGVGESTEKRLHSVGVVTVGDIYKMPEARLARCVGRAAAQRLAGLAAGLEVRPVTPHGRE
ncbi:MAG: DNA polymerase IV, partial [Actinomycetes bacterium]